MTVLPVRTGSRSVGFLIGLLLILVGCDGSGTSPESPALESGSIEITSISSPQMAGQSFEIDLTVTNSNGNPATSYSGVLDLTLSKGSSIRPTSTNFTSSDNGTKTLSVTLPDAATGVQITATDDSERTITGTSNTFNVDVSPASPGWHRKTMQSNNQKREFKYYVPSDLPANAPVVMALHGATIGMDGMFPEDGSGPSSEWTNIADEDGLLLVVPNASHSFQPVWNDCTPLPNRGTPDDSKFLDQLTNWTKNRADVNPDRMYVYGVSNGGQMANRLAIEHPDQFAGIAAFLSNINSQLGEGEECPKPSEPIPVLTVSGKSDDITPFEGGGANVWGEELLSARATQDFWEENNITGDLPSPQTVDYTEDINTISFCERTPAPETGADVQLCAFKGGHTIPSKPSFDFESARLAWRFLHDQ